MTTSTQTASPLALAIADALERDAICLSSPAAAEAIDRAIDAYFSADDPDWRMKLISQQKTERPRNQATSLEQLAEIERLKAEVEKLAKFKAYVHERLDKAGVPVDPDPEQNRQHGCRIDGRLTWLFRDVERLRKALVEISDTIECVNLDSCQAVREAAQSSWGIATEAMGDVRRDGAMGVSAQAAQDDEGDRMSGDRWE